MNKLFTQLLESRGLTADYLRPDYESTTDPLTLIGMDRAIERIERAIKNQEKILIYGDYDVDGITASTVMEQALKLAGVAQGNITIMLPDRFIDGYGMSPRLVEKAKIQNINLVITVDCGSRNHEIVAQLNQAHIDTIITDHHETGVEKAEDLPQAIAVINPHRPDQKSDQKDQKTDQKPSQKSGQNNRDMLHLAGVGVAFKLAQALAQKGHIKNGQEKWLLDLVLIGTLCDRMELSLENRILCYYGLIVLSKTRRPGLKELMRLARVKTFTSEAIGFQIGPRLNAAGRLETAEIALNLLRTDSHTQAAAQLEQLNSQRRTAQQAALKEITQRGVSTDSVIVESGHWHEGIIGIVAGRLLEQYHKPTFVLTETEPGVYKGSGRSFGDFSLAEALQQVQPLLLNGGGHAGAAGVRLLKDNLQPFREQINKYYASLHLPDQSKFLTTHADLEAGGFSDFTSDFLADLNTLEPFGPGNPEPVFAVTAEVLELRRMGSEGQHLRIDARSPHDKKIMKLIAFNAPTDWFSLDQNHPYRFLLQPVENEFNGICSVEGRLCDIIEL